MNALSARMGLEKRKLVSIEVELHSSEHSVSSLILSVASVKRNFLSAVNSSGGVNFVNSTDGGTEHEVTEASVVASSKSG